MSNMLWKWGRRQSLTSKEAEGCRQAPHTVVWGGGVWEGTEKGHSPTASSWAWYNIWAPLSSKHYREVNVLPRIHLEACFLELVVAPAQSDSFPFQHKRTSADLFLLSWAVTFLQTLLTIRFILWDNLCTPTCSQTEPVLAPLILVVKSCQIAMSYPSMVYQL